MIIDGWHIPDYDRHFGFWLNNGREYEGQEKRAVEEHLAERRIALDIGAHIGLWARWLLERFNTVHAFEPDPENFECLYRNAPDAIGIQKAIVSHGYPEATLCRDPKNSGDIWLGDGGPWVQTAVLDQMFHDDIRDRIDFIKIDTQGAEHEILKGGAELIARCRPLILLEEDEACAKRFGAEPGAAVEWLKDAGYGEVYRHRRNVLMQAEEAA